MLSFSVITETNKVQWIDWCGANRWWWIWCNTSCKTCWVGNSCLQATEIFSHRW